MKNLTVLMVLALSMLGTKVNAQYVTIPDTAFVTFLTNTYPQCMSGNQMDTTCTAIVNEVYISMLNYNVADLSGVEYFDNLEELGVFDAPNLITLGQLPASLRFINIQNCGLTTVTHIPDSVNTIYFLYNQLSTLPAVMPNNLEYLSLDNNLSLTTLPQLPDDLKGLFISYTSIASLPDPLPLYLDYLEISNTPIDTLPDLPQYLGYLSMKFANITTIANLPNGIEYFNANFSRLNQLSTLGDSLHTFLCESCFLTNLPALPHTIRNMQVSNNFLTYIPEVPSYMDSLIIGNNPLDCLPRLTSIGELGIGNTNAVCRSGPTANISSFTGTDYNALPICNSINTNSCPTYSSINGRAYQDGNNNCIFDSLDQGFEGAKVQLFRNGQLQYQTYTDQNGYYSIDIQNNYGTYQVVIDSSTLPYSITCPDTAYYSTTLSAGNPNVTDIDFGLSCGNGYDIGVQSINRPIGWFRPGSQQYVQIIAGDLSNLYGSNCADGISAEVKVVLSGAAGYLSASGTLAPTSVNGDTVIWNVNDVASINIDSSFGVGFIIDTFALFNDHVCFDVYISSVNLDTDTTNDHLYFCIQVQSSFDPNDKQVSPIGDIDTTQKWLYYSIRFQNTGTAPAQNIRVEDTLSQYLDYSTFQVLNASHYNVTEISQNGVVNFNFPNIELPDSNYDEPNSHGFINYKIKLKDNQPIGSSIENTAYIYFDFNPPIVTNTTVNTIFTPLQQPSILLSAADACEGDTLTLETTYDQTYTYTWYLNEVPLNNSNTNTLEVTQAGNYKVNVTNGVQTTTSDVEAVSFNPLPSVDLNFASMTFCEGDAPADLSSFGTPAGGTFSGSRISNDMLDVSRAGTLTVEYSYTDNNGCSDTKQANAVVEVCIGVEELEVLGIKVYPNPASNTIWIELTENTTILHVKLIDLNGKVVAAATTTNNGFNIDVSELPSKNYLLVMTSEEGKVVTSSSIQIAH